MHTLSGKLHLFRKQKGHSDNHQIHNRIFAPPHNCEDPVKDSKAIKTPESTIIKFI